MNEKNDFHPMVGLWLTENGYTYDHEVQMPDYGIVDFLAKDKQGNIYLLECKPSNPALGISQVVFYRHQIPQSKAMVVALTEHVGKQHFELAKKYDVELVTLDAPLSAGIKIMRWGTQWLTEAEAILLLKKKHPDQFNITQITEVKQVTEVALPANELAGRIAALSSEHQKVIEQAIRACEGTSIIPLDTPQDYYTIAK